jgi:hypothetical protein
VPFELYVSLRTFCSNKCLLSERTRIVRRRFENARLSSRFLLALARIVFLTHPPSPRCPSSVFGLCRVSENFPSTSASHSRFSGCVFSPIFPRPFRASLISSFAHFRRIFHSLSRRPGGNLCLHCPAKAETDRSQNPTPN